MVPKSFKMLLLQARNDDDPMRGQEHECFAQRSGLELEQVVCHDLLAGAPSKSEFKKYDVISVGGSGDYYVSKGNLPHFEGFMDCLREIVVEGQPTFSSCYGFQAMARALGGEVIFDPENTEVGTYELELTAAGKEDPLFGNLPQKFMAQLGHKDRVVTLPDGFEHLAQSPLCPLQAFKVKDKPIWAAQFHPELDHLTNKHRFTYYIDGYINSMPGATKENVLSRFVPSPESSDLLKSFVALITKS